ncbi:hypothetical protein PV08_10817 [Exophiala spinifera]|uniref:THUMP domain-containing protein n=1 Tax=Exophiala spinifera TaxID=91928 RepID=A0A0D1Y988_9EURO|nr:uncharacterized protein PV08_10817 [Exophiala spinifera]KIW11516.1 hypothetical protein PV08_10817 [Exophiala spinifera]
MDHAQKAASLACPNSLTAPYGIQNGKATGKIIRQNRSFQRHDSSRGRDARPIAISASGIHSGDHGIFVTCDKGQERKCLQEISDILGEYIESTSQPAQEPDLGICDANVDIETAIFAELESLRSMSSTTGSQSPKLSFITLDIPCVSFIRFPTSTNSERTLDPVEIVRHICEEASRKDSTGPRSRYVRRLTPVSLVRKTLNNGLESLCDEVLPPEFRIDVVGEGPSSGCKFAIRPTIRNNEKFNRDDVIRMVADRIAALGNGKHSVDLKGYDKLVLIDVYRNIVGMSVVGNEFERLRRFNLAELHATHLGEADLGTKGEQLKAGGAPANSQTQSTEPTGDRRKP